MIDKKVQLNTDLLKLRPRYLYRKRMHKIKLNKIKSVLNEIRSVIKMGKFFNKEMEKNGWPRVFFGDMIF